MDKDPNKRIGAKDKSEIKKDKFFKQVNWEGLLCKTIEAPFHDFEDEDDDDDDWVENLN